MQVVVAKAAFTTELPLMTTFAHYSDLLTEPKMAKEG